MAAAPSGKSKMATTEHQLFHFKMAVSVSAVLAEHVIQQLDPDWMDGKSKMAAS